MSQGTGTMEETLGQYLCHMRAQKGVSLEDIAKATRIDPRYLQAVEQNDFSHLPRAEIFAKAYVKAYARCLSLEEAEVMRRFAESPGDLAAYASRRAEARSHTKNPNSNCGTPSHSRH